MSAILSSHVLFVIKGVCHEEVFEPPHEETQQKRCMYSAKDLDQQILEKGWVICVILSTKLKVLG